MSAADSKILKNMQKKFLKMCGPTTGARDHKSKPCPSRKSQPNRARPPRRPSISASPPSPPANLVAGGSHETLLRRLPLRLSLCLLPLSIGRPAAALTTGGRPAAPAPVGVLAGAQRHPESGGPSTCLHWRRLWG